MLNRVTLKSEIGSRSDGLMKELVSDGGKISKILFWVFLLSLG